MQLEIRGEEKVLLADILDSAFRDLKEEINKTEAHEFKQQLKVREELLAGLLDRIRTLS
jgi:hypothetical protein